ncbi:choloylglycine hydrolase family protein [Lapidilactobacillus wuchangensis]|uniref:choloylglycine hydrolase family protein n=1 Tax=Lapidilactobacillus wuchangensis TaxID=2486001 RepID=UPI000F78F4F6|nr:choloylglycine hydrolase family protein [Lapidilactobacillus wuchangensis]
MCTSISYLAKNDHVFLGRTMDFGFELNGHPIAIPRHYQWQSQLGETYTFKYGFIGIGRKLDDYLFADGVNEHGLAVAELYFAGEAAYAEVVPDKKGQLAAHEFIMWVLGNLSSVAEVKSASQEITLVDLPSKLLKVTSPLHFIMTDATGACIVVEPEADGLHIIDNQVGVMANSPEFPWHLTNLRNYLGLDPHSVNHRQLGDVELQSFGPGSGTFGLPGGYSSPERFVRAAYLRNTIQASTDTDANVTNLFRILDNVTIPKGAKLQTNGEMDYTQYRVVMDLTTKTVYFQPYNSLQLFAARLTDELLEQDQVTEFTVNPGLGAISLN